jgi:PKD repeat protein
MEKLGMMIIRLVFCTGMVLAVSCTKEKDWDPGEIEVVADFDFSLDHENAPAVLTVEDKSVNGFTYLWQFPGGNPETSMDRQPKVTYKEAGTYEIALTVCNGTSCRDVTKSVIVKAPVLVESSANFAFSFVGGSDYSPAAVTFTDLSKNPLTWAWTFEGGEPGASDRQAPGTVTYATGGKYAVRLQVSNGGVSAEHTDSIKVYPGELVCSSPAEQQWVAPISYGEMTIGSISLYLDKERTNEDVDNLKSGYGILIYGAAMSIITGGKETSDLLFQAPASWDWTIGGSEQSLQVTISYMGLTASFSAAITQLEGDTMGLGASDFEAMLAGLINSVDGSGTLLGLLSQPHQFSKIEP